MQAADAAAAESLADALADDAFYAFITAPLPPAQRRSAMVAYMAASLAEGRAAGRVVAEPLGAAIWTLPDDDDSSGAQAAAAAKHAALDVALGAAGLARRAAVVDSMTRLCAPLEQLRHAWYLSILGVAPAAQRGGVARRLLAPTLRECDEQRAAAWLETYGAETLPVYERFGFKVLGQPFVEPVRVATYYIMLRPPQPVAG